MGTAAAGEGLEKAQTHGRGIPAGREPAPDLARSARRTRRSDSGSPGPYPAARMEQASRGREAVKIEPRNARYHLGSRAYGDQASRAFSPRPSRWPERSSGTRPPGTWRPGSSPVRPAEYYLRSGVVGGEGQGGGGGESDRRDRSVKKAIAEGPCTSGTRSGRRPKPPCCGPPSNTRGTPAPTGTWPNTGSTAKTTGERSTPASRPWAWTRNPGARRCWWLRRG